jgi:polysaccharide biosynthesis/export protein
MTRRRHAGWPAILALALAGAAPPSPRPSPLPSPTPPPAASPVPAQPPDYRIGAGDILDVVVFGNEDLSRTATVQTTGTIALPLIGEIRVEGSTIDEVKDRITAALGKDYLVNPQVDVKVREYQSQFVTVIGEVNTPGRKALRGRTRLIDALVEAGGFNTRASGDVVVSRTDGTLPGGQTSLRLRLVGSANPVDQAHLELYLKPGDIITAPPKYYVTVEGEVARPGRFQLEGDLTVSGALTEAGGLTRFGSSKVRVRRFDVASGTTRILEVDLGDVRKGKKPDLALMPNDVVTVSRRRF